MHIILSDTTGTSVIFVLCILSIVRGVILNGVLCHLVPNAICSTCELN